MEPDDPASPSLDRLLDRATEAAAEEQLGDAPVQVGVANDDWLVMSGDDTATGDRGRWIASDTYVDVVQERA